MDNERLATELLHEIKASATRWFYAFLVMCIIEICTISGFLWYISLPADEVSVESTDGNANYVGNDLNGDLNNGENNRQEAPQGQTQE